MGSCVSIPLVKTVFSSGELLRVIRSRTVPHESNHGVGVQVFCPILFNGSLNFGDKTSLNKCILNLGYRNDVLLYTALGGVEVMN